MKVIIADDSQPVRELLVEMLSEFSDIEIVGQTDDALEVTDLVRSAKPDVLILDLRLRRGNGLGVLATIKREMPSLIVMMLSGQPRPEYRDKCMEFGADYFFRKSDGFDELIKTLTKLTSDRTSSPGS